jgi:glycosyltransferase EpsH
VKEGMATARRPAVSVCVPVYNAARHLAECLDSLLAQTLMDLEIVITNDGSTDDSQQIIDRYASADSRIKVTIQANKGLGATRNAGILAASGTYVAFLDADDRAEPRCYEQLYQRAKNTDADLVVSDYYVWRDTGTSTMPVPVRNRFTGSKDAYLRAVLEGEAAGFSWNKLYRRKLLVNAGLFFPTREELENVEDQYYSLRTIHLSKRIAFVPEPLVYYRVHGSSIVNKYQQTLLRDLTRLVDANLEFSRREQLPVWAQQALDRAFIKGAVACALNECKPTNPHPLRERVRRLGELAAHPHFLRAYDEARRANAVPAHHVAILRPLRHGYPSVAFALAWAYALSIRLRT